MDITARIATLSPAKRALLELALDEQLSIRKLSAASVIPRQQQRDKAPLSYAQQRLWFLDQLHPGRADYNLPQLLQMDGLLNSVALRDAINAIVARHEALRTTFGKQGDERQQFIADELRLDLPLVDLCDHQPPAAELRRLIDAETAQAFDLASGPLLRAKLFRLAVQQHTLLVTIHHIVSDGWSMEVFNRELGVLYNAYCHNRPVALAKLPVQYLDYAIWQRQQTANLQQQLEYWRHQLHDAIQVLELPTDKPRPAVQSFNGKRYNSDLSPQLSAALNRLAKQENATLFMVLLSAFQVLLHRYSGQDDILVGTPIAGRSHLELEGLIGLFVNSLIMRSRFEPDMSSRQLLAQVRETALGAFGHQELPFEKLVEELAPQRDMSRNPLFQVMFAMQNDVPPTQMQQLSVSSPDFGGDKAKFDITLFVSEGDKGLRASFNYATDLFDDTTIERMARHYRNLLSAIVADPDQHVAKLPLLSDEERHTLLRAWNDTACDFYVEKTIQQLFEAQVERTPAVTALVSKEQRLSYSELNRRANQLAHYLIGKGVGPDMLVGISLERSAEMIVGLLAILKAGGAYLPLDPSYPIERLRWMMDDADITLLLSHGHLLASLPATQATSILLDRDWPNIARQPDHNPVTAVSPGNLAYVIYTSGSTGKPKGVMVEHASVINLALALNKFIYEGHAVRQRNITLNAPLAFDASIQQWTRLLWGDTLHVLQQETRRNGHALADYLAANEIDVLDCIPSQLKLLLKIGLFDGGRHAPEIVLAGGEAIDHSLWGKLIRITDVAFYNLYGPTECTVDSTSCRIDQKQANPIIGRPLANICSYVLDRHRQPVPVGVAGELWLGGKGIARGYLHQPQLTAECFITNPYSTQAGARIYKTGDLVRYRPDGNIEYLGRIDRQLKLRGFRIEPGEIESVLQQQSGVRDAVVIVREDQPGNPYLTAYLIPSDAPPQTGTLQNALKARLPLHMVPSIYVMLEAWPLTPSGKLDHKALPAPGATVTVGDSDKPRNTLEFHLVKIWEDVLGRTPVGIHDNFFELGGHSLLAVKLFDRIEKNFGKKLPLDTLWFEGATIETLARILEREQEAILWPELVQIKAGGDRAPLFCVHTMGGNLFHYYELARALSPQQPAYGLQARGVYGKQAPRDNIADIASDCINAMRQRQANGPYRIAGFSSGGIVAFEMAQQLLAIGERVSCLALLDCYAPGIKIKRGVGKTALKLFSLKDLRRFQERFYHRILQSLGLRRLRSLQTIGEFHRWAHWSYKPTPYPGRIDLFVAAESEKNATDPLLGWNQVAAGDLVVHSVSGVHGLIVKSPYVDALAEKLQRLLDHGSP